MVKWEQGREKVLDHNSSLDQSPQFILQNAHTTAIIENGTSVNEYYGF